MWLRALFLCCIFSVVVLGNEQKDCSDKLARLTSSILNIGRISSTSLPNSSKINSAAESQTSDGGAEGSGEAGMQEDGQSEESSESGPSQSPRSLPPVNDQYQVSNLDVEKSDEQPKLLAQSDADSDFWKIMHYIDIDPFTNLWSNPSGEWRPLISSTEKADHQMHLVDLESLSPGLLLLPAGFYPLRISPEMGELSVNDAGNFLLIPRAQSLSIDLKQELPKPLSDKEFQQYTKIDNVSDSSWPDWTRKLLTQMDDLKAEGASETKIAQLVAKTLKSEGTYTKKASEAGSVIDQARCGEFQCQGATSIATTLLRGRGIATRPVGGYPADEGDGSGMALYFPKAGHARIEVFDNKEMKWMPVEVTPPGEGSPEHGHAPGSSPSQKNNQAMLNWKIEDLQERWMNLLESTLKDKNQSEALVEALDSYFEEDPNVLEIPAASRIHSSFEEFKNKRELKPLSLEKMKERIEAGLTRMGDYRDLKRSTEFYENVLNQIAKSRSLSVTEDKLYRDLVDVQNGLVAAFSKATSDEELGKALYEQLPGERTKSLAKSQAGTNKRGEINWKKFAQLAQSEEWEPMMKTVQAMKLVEFNPSASQEQAHGTQFTAGWNRTQTDGAIRMRTAESPDELANVNLDGVGHEEALLLLMAGEFQYPVYRQPKKSLDGPQMSSKTNSVILEDYSGSMSEMNKYVVREAIAAGAIDSLHRSDADPRGEGKVWLMPFTETPSDPTLVEDPLAVMTEKWESPTGNYGGNSISQALKGAVKLLKQEKSEHFNIILLTDGEDSFRAGNFIDSIKSVFPKTRVNLHAVMIAGSNPELQKSVESLNELLGNNGMSRYVEISAQENMEIAEDGNTPNYLNTLSGENAARKALPAVSATIQRLKRSISSLDF